MGHIYRNGVRITKTLWEIKAEIYAKEAAAFDGIPTQTSKGGRKYKLCPLCGVPAWRFKNDLRVWYAHRLPDGTWCNGLKPDSPASEHIPCEDCGEQFERVIGDPNTLCPTCGKAADGPHGRIV